MRRSVPARAILVYVCMSTWPSTVPTCRFLRWAEIAQHRGQKVVACTSLQVWIADAARTCARKT